jgi:hypothetical protein
MSEEHREGSSRVSQDQTEPRSATPEVKPPDAGKMPPAGPHARPELTDKDKTPGSGMLPEPDDSNPSPTG